MLYSNARNSIPKDEGPMTELLETDTAPSAEIEKIWADHNAYQYGMKGIKIHVRFTITNLKGQTLSFCTYFYQEDNITQLHDAYGNHFACDDCGISNYDNSVFEDFDLFMPYVD